MTEILLTAIRWVRDSLRNKREGLNLRWFCRPVNDHLESIPTVQDRSHQSQANLSRERQKTAKNCFKCLRNHRQRFTCSVIILAELGDFSWMSFPKSSNGQRIDLNDLNQF